MCAQANFDIEVAARSLDSNLLQAAEAEFDRLCAHIAGCLAATFILFAIEQARQGEAQECCCILEKPAQRPATAGQVVVQWQLEVAAALEQKILVFAELGQECARASHTKESKDLQTSVPVAFRLHVILCRIQGRKY